MDKLCPNNHIYSNQLSACPYCGDAVAADNRDSITVFIHDLILSHETDISISTQNGVNARIQAGVVRLSYAEHPSGGRFGYQFEDIPIVCGSRMRVGNNTILGKEFIKMCDFIIDAKLSVLGRHGGTSDWLPNKPNGIIKRVSPKQIHSLDRNEIFVFGSNLQGFHAGGAARIAYERFGAVWGQGVGLQGRAYAIPTMQGGVATIKPYVDEFLEFAQAHPELKFLVTEIGCGIAGFAPVQIAPLFHGAVERDMENIYLPESFYQ